MLDAVHCRLVSGGGVGSIGGVDGGGAHPSDDQKDDDASGGRGGTRHYRGDCDDVAGSCRRHISRGCDRDYDDDDNNAGQRDRGSAPRCLLHYILRVGGTCSKLQIIFVDSQ